MRRLYWTTLIVAVALAIYGCGLTTEVPVEDEDEFDVAEEPTTTTLAVEASGEAGGVLDIATLLPLGTELSGDLEFEATAGDLFYTQPFTIQIVPPDSDEVDDKLLALLDAEIDQLLKDLAPLDGAVVLTQPRGDGTDQTTFGRAGGLADGSLRLITGAEDDNFTEAFILDMEPCEAWPDCDHFTVNGSSVGVSPEVGLGQALQHAVRVLARNPPDEELLLWGSYVAGQMRQGNLPPQPSIAGEILDMSSGTYEGEQWIKMDLVGPIVVEQDLKRYSIEFRTNEEDLIIAAYNVEPGGDPFSTSFCVGQTPSCPDGIFGIVGEPNANNDSLVFRFAGDAFANSTDPTFAAFVEIGPADSPEDRVTFHFHDGERFPLLTDESDPFE